MEGHGKTSGSHDFIDVSPSVIAQQKRQQSRKRNWLIAITIVVAGVVVFGALYASGRIVIGQATYDRADARVESFDRTEAFPQVGRVAGDSSIDPALAAELAKLQGELATLSSLLSTVGSLNTTSAAAMGPTIIREIIRTAGGGSIDTSDFVTRALFDAQVNGTNYSIESVGDGIAESVGTGALTVSGNTTLSGLTAATTTLSKLTVSGDTTLGGSLTLAALAGGVLTTDANGLVSTTTIGAASIVDDSLDFAQLADALTVDATTTFDLDTNSADLNFDSGTLFVDSSANRIGIGTTSPSQKFEVYGDSADTRLQITDTGSNAIAAIQFGNASQNWQVANRGDLSNKFIIRDLTAGAYRLAINSSGNVGLGGELSPFSKLSVLGNLSIGDSTTYTQTAAPAGGAIIQGNVGIGTTSPASKFDVWGDLRVGTSSTPTLFAQSSTGNVGIGTTNPDKLLTISAGATNQALGLDDSGIYVSRTVNGSYSGSITRSAASSASTVGWDYEGNLAVTHKFTTTGAVVATVGTQVGTSGTTGILSVDNISRLRSINGLANSPLTLLSDDASGGSDGIVFNRSSRTDAGNNAVTVWQYAGTELGRFTTAGNVGIGTTTPQERLHVDSGSDNNVAYFNGNGSYSWLDIYNGDANRVQMGNANDGEFAVRTSDAIRLLVDTTGNVGIGTTSPNYKLSVVDSTTYIASQSTSASGSGRLYSINSSNDIGSLTTYGSSFSQSHLANNTAVAAQNGLYLMSDSGVSAGGSNSINFLTGGYSSGQTRMVITSTGNVGIGTTTPGQKLTVAGTIQATNLIGGAVNLTTDASGNIIRDPSDIRLKTNINDIDGALDKLLALHGVSYQWKDTARFGTQTEIGFIAQEVDPILPEVVRKGGDYWSINTRNILAVVVEGFKDFYAEFLVLRDTVAGFAHSITSDRVTAGELCVDDICVTREEFAAMVAASGSDPASSPAAAEADEDVAEPGPDSAPEDDGVATTTPESVEAEAAVPMEDEEPELITLVESPSIETPDTPEETDDPIEMEETVTP